MTFPVKFEDEDQVGDSASSNMKKADQAKVVFTLLICIVGLLGNMVVLFVVIVMKEFKRSVTHWYVLQLAVADSVLLLTLPFRASEELNKAWIYPEWMCKANETLFFINYYASILFLMIMSADRYIAVCHHFSEPLQKLRKLKSAIFISLGVWLMSVLMSIPIMLYAFKTGNQPNCICGYIFPGEESRGMSDDDLKALQEINLSYDDFGDGHCWKNNALDHTNGSADKYSNFDLSVLYDLYDLSNLTGLYDPYGFNSYSGGSSSNVSADDDNNEIQSCTFKGKSQGWIAIHMFIFTVMFLLPLVVMMLCYGLILNQFNRTQVRSHSIKSVKSTESDASQNKKCRKKSSSHSGRERRRITLMCGALVGVFVICWLPYHAIKLAHISGIPGDAQYCETLNSFGSFLAFLNSALNPLLYTFMGSTFTDRWKLASKSFRRSIGGRSRRRSSSVFQSIRLKRRTSRGSCNTSHSAIVSTKLTKNTNGKSAVSSEAQDVNVVEEQKKNSKNQPNESTSCVTNESSR